MIEGTLLAIKAPSLAFQYHQILFSVILGVVLVAAGIWFRKREGESLPFFVSLGSALSLITATIILSKAQAAIKQIYWYEIQFPTHYKINYYVLISLAIGLIIVGTLLTYYILYRVEDGSKRKKLSASMVIMILSIAITASIGSSMSVPEKETTFEYELSLENISEETSYVLYVPTIYNTRKDKTHVVLDAEEVKATLSHVNSTRGITLKINGTGPIDIDFYYQGSEKDYDLTMSEMIENSSNLERERFLLYYNSSSAQRPDLDLRYERSVPIRNLEFQMSGSLNATGWQYVNASYGISVS